MENQLAYPVKFKHVNFTYTAPKGQEDVVSDLPVYRGLNSTTSCWKLSPEELFDIMQTGKIYLSIWGHSVFPVYVASEEEMVKQGYLPDVR
jgi:hypothetical protein